MEPQRKDQLADPLIDEVGERRRQLLEEHDNDLRRLLETIRREQAKHPEKVIDLRRRKIPGG